MSDERLARVEQKLDDLISQSNANFADLKGIASNHVTRQEFDPIRKGFYGLVSFVFLAVGGAVVRLIGLDK